MSDKHLGSFDNEEDAARAYNEFARSIGVGERANPVQPSEQMYPTQKMKKI
jgi:hypothetical protein